MNWVELMYKAERYGIEGLVYTTLSILREIIGNHDDIFHHVSGFPSEGLDKELLRLIHKRIFIREDDLASIPDPIIQSQVAHTFQEKVKILLKYVFPNPEAISKRYSVPLSSKRLYLYYLIRPFSLLIRYRKTIFQIPRIKEEVILKRWISTKDEKFRKNKTPLSL